jgi:tRNA(Leu) C34 or U34 (ribose-2'-O)-methylase TrmL
MPAVALTNPKYRHNVGAAIRACSCWGIERLIWSGTRVPHPEEWENDEELRQYRLPREERMKGYFDVERLKVDRFKDIIEKEGYTPVAVEIQEGSEMLFNFEHPENPIYIFGPEDGSLDWRTKQHCHRFIQIPTQHCLNLSCAVNVVLSHRAQQLYQTTGHYLKLKEERGFIS